MKYTRVFISPVNTADDLFSEGGGPIGMPRAMFFGCENGNHENWLGELNA